eukprot:TRINITY_DN3583_c0_g2_i1.p1 TRINITY_DN3583_c0_g2~~TRINITY_DN3583_c0_g2_i1.p1  ORF type:complete len:395 (+),score=105.40 TRINITY_DN3583_c0_g2_i1:146-1330(+)
MKKAFNTQSDMSMNLRKYIVDLTVVASQSPYEKKQLAQKDIIHLLINAALESNSLPSSNYNRPLTIMLSKESIRILYNASSMESIKYSPYIPGITQEQQINRNRIIQWGGLVCLRYICQNSRVREIQEFCSNTMLKHQFGLKEIAVIIESIKGYFQLQAATSYFDQNNGSEVQSNLKKELESPILTNQLSASSIAEEHVDAAKIASGKEGRKKKAGKLDYKHICFPESFNTKIDLRTMFKELEEEYTTTKEEISRKKEEEVHKKKIIIEEEKKKEEEEAIRKEKKQHQLQEYLNFIHDRKKEQSRKDKQTRKADKREATEDSRNNTIIARESKGEYPHEYRIKHIKKQADIGRMKALDLQKRQIEHQDKQLKACLLYTSPSPRDATLSRMPSSA